MRLTLRTLLAWLDDTLPAPEVRQIGHQVQESPLARDLVDRIRKVTRQRRLAVPGANGSDPTDPNQVASYLDSTLEPELVADFEKRCLKSDVHLAEVACVHQILSLLGQKAKVPPEARQRMYRLVRGQDPQGTSRPRALLASNLDRPMAASSRLSLEAPIVPSALERYGIPIAVLALMSLLSLSTWWSLRPSDGTDPETSRAPLTDPALAANLAPPTLPAPAGRVPPDQASRELAAPVDNGTPRLPTPDRSPAGEPVRERQNLAPEVIAAEPLPMENQGDGNRPTDAGDLVRTEPGSDQLALWSKPDQRAWQLLGEDQPLSSETRVVSLAPFRTALRFRSGSRALLLGGTVAQIEPQVGAIPLHLALEAGRLVLPEWRASESIAIDLAVDHRLTLTPAAGSTLGLERTDPLTQPPGNSGTPSVTVTVLRGGVELADEQQTITLSEGQGVTYQVGSGFGAPAPQAIPDWLADPEPSIAEQELGRQFARFFKPGTAPLTALVEATVDQRPEIQCLALQALANLGQTTVLVGAFNSQGESGSAKVREAAIVGMRQVLAHGGPAASQLRRDLTATGGSEEWTDLVIDLLAGFSSIQAEDPMTLARLVQWLQHDDVGVRDLALQNLLALSRRGDSLGYDPEHPDGPGLKRWHELLQRQEILVPEARR